MGLFFLINKTGLLVHYFYFFNTFLMIISVLLSNVNNRRWVSPSPFTLCCYCCWVTSVVSDSVRPHRREPTRLPRPWDSPGKNTGVGCHFLLQRMKVKSESEVAQSCPTPSDPMDRSPPGSSIHGLFQARVLEWGAIALSVSLSTHIQFLSLPYLLKPALSSFWWDQFQCLHYLDDVHYSWTI